MTDRIEIKASVVTDDAGTISGVAWPFGTTDQVGDIVEKGAFSFPRTLPIVVEHDQKQVVGVWEEFFETDKGLEVKGRLFVEGITPARSAHRYLKAGVIEGLSIGFRNQGYEPRPEGGRRLQDVYVTEISLCRDPVNSASKITEVKSNPLPKQETLKLENEEIETEQKAVTPANDTPQVPQIDTKAFDKVIARLDKLEAKGKRPQISGPANPDMGEDEMKSFAAEVKSLAYGSGTGGILAPDAVSKTILEKVAEFSPMRGEAQKIQMSGSSLQIPRLVNEVNPTEVGETDAKPESEPSFEEIDLKNFTLGVVVPVTRTLLEDAHVDLSAYLGNHIARRFGQKESSWFINGNGTTQPEGVLTSNEVANNEVGAIDGDTLIDHFYSLKTAYALNGAWMMNRKTMALVRKLKDGNGQYIWQEGIAGRQPPQIMGRPVLEAVDMPDPSAGNTPIVFGDFYTGYTIGDRIAFELIKDEITGAVNDIVKLIARRRVGGRVVMGEALSKLSLAA